MGGVPTWRSGSTRRLRACKNNALPEHVTYGMVGDRAVFLDVRRDRYFSIDIGRCDDWHAIFTGDEPLQSAPDLIALLRSRDALNTVLTDPAYLVPAHGEPVIDSILEHGTPREPITLKSLYKTFAAFRRSKYWLRRYSLEDTLVRLRARPGRAVDREKAMRAATIFHACRRIVPVKPACLIDSVSLAAFLIHERAPADIAFGVQDDPFRAHCWVQIGDVVLNDSVHRVRSFVTVRQN